MANVEDIIEDLLVKKNTYSAVDMFDEYKNVEGATQNLDVISPSDWYKTFPYEITAIKVGENLKYDPSIAKDDTTIHQFVYSLPIPPEAISTTMIPASQVTPTLGGVVEETSKNIFWNISLQGTTGISANRNNPFTQKVDTRTPATTFRETKKTLGLLSGALDKFASLSQTAVDMASDFKNGETIEALNKLFTTTPIFTDSAVERSSNGYYEMMLFHRFLLLYSELKEKEPDRWVLVFRNHKDAMEWRVVLQDFRIVKTKANPHMYRYSLVFKGWQASPLIYLAKEQDRFKAGGDLNGLKTFTATGAATKIANLVAMVASGPSAIIDSITGSSPVI